MSDPVELRKRLKYQNYWNDFTSDINITKHSNQSDSFLFGPIENTSLSPLPVPEIDFIVILLNAFLFQTKGSQYNIYDYHPSSSAHNSLLTNKKAGKYINDLSRPIRNPYFIAIVSLCPITIAILIMRRLFNILIF